jgi:hypothetical protein
MHSCVNISHSHSSVTIHDACGDSYFGRECRRRNPEVLGARSAMQVGYAYASFAGPVPTYEDPECVFR